MEDEDNIDNNINENWKNIKTIIEGKKQLIENDESTQTLKNRWYDGERKIAIEGMKKLKREKWLVKGSWENEKQEYHHKRKAAHKIIRNKKNYV